MLHRRFNICYRCVSSVVRSLIDAPTARIPPHADTSPETGLAASRAPGPTCTAANREVVVAEGEDGAGGADEVPEEDVKAVVPEVGEPRGRDVDTGEERDDGEDEEVDWWGCCLAANGGQSVFLLCEIGIAC